MGILTIQWGHMKIFIALLQLSILILIFSTLFSIFEYINSAGIKVLPDRDIIT